MKVLMVSHFLHFPSLYVYLLAFELLLTASITCSVTVPPPLYMCGREVPTSSQTSRRSTVNPRNVHSSASGSSSGDDDIDDDEDRSFATSIARQWQTADMMWTKKHLSTGLCPRSTDRTAVLPANLTFSCVRVMEVTAIDLLDVGFPVDLLMVSDCASDWPKDAIGREIRRNCTSPNNSVARVLFSSPVSTSKVTYKNIYCAVCNRESNWTDVHFWRPYLHCTNVLGSRSSWSAPTSTSSKAMQEMLTDERCSNKGHRIPDVIPPLWECSDNYVIGRCPAFEDMEKVGITLDRLEYECIQEKCTRGEVDLLYSSTRERHPVVRNPYCAYCNGFNSTELESRNTFSSCSKDSVILDQPGRTPPGAAGYLPILIDFDLGNGMHISSGFKTTTITCPKWNVYDFKQQKCRQVFAVQYVRPEPKEAPSFPSNKSGIDRTTNNSEYNFTQFQAPVVTTRLTDKNGSQSFNMTGRNLTSNCYLVEGAQLLVCNGSDSFPLSCDKVIALEKSEYTVSDDGDIYNRVTGGYLHIEEYFFFNGTVYTCTVLLQNHTTSHVVWDLNIVPVAVSATVCTISGLCCFIVFITYCLFAELRKLPGICTMCYVFSIGVSYFILLVGSHQVGNSSLCTAMGFLLHYFCLCQFSWSAIIAVNMTRSFVFSSSMSSQSTSRRSLYIYFGIGWGLPLLVCLTLLILDQATELDIDYATDQVCWLQPTLPLLVGFVIPVAVVLVFNLFVFLILVVSIHNTMKLATPAKPQGLLVKARRKLRIFTGIYSLLGLTWLVALLASVEGLQMLWYFFFVITLLQGLSLLIIFTLNKKTRSLYRSKFRRWFASSSSSYETKKMAYMKATSA